MRNSSILEKLDVTEGFTSDFYFTGTPKAESPNDEAARKVFDEIAIKVRDGGVQPIQEKIYGRMRAKEKILAARRDAYVALGLDPAPLPITFVEGRPLHDGDLAGVQLWGLGAGDCRKISLVTVRHRAGWMSRSWEEGGSRFLFLSSVQGSTRKDGRFPSGGPRQAERMYHNAAQALKELHFSFSHVIRSWIYLRGIVSWYGKFNAIRSGLFRRTDFAGDGRISVPPASTGIDGSDSKGKCLMDLLAVDPGDSGTVRVTPITQTSRQGSALSYGSAFSRGLSLRVAKKHTVYVSGTASIDAAGKSLHRNNPELQVHETLMNIGALLEEQGGSLANIVSATLFCKNHRAYDAYERIVRLLAIPQFPVVVVLADVCRPELLVEIEAVAAL